MRKMIIDIYPPVAKPRPRVREVSLVWSGARSMTLILFVVLSAAVINAVGTTAAYYFDSETSRDNFFAAASLDFTVEIEKPDNRFQTFTQGGWGSTAQGDNPGVYRDANFAAAFPSGAVIGLPDSNFSATFTDATAVENFLPSGSTPTPFIQDHVDPTATEAGALAGQVLALTLNVGFDLFDSNFAPSVSNLNDYTINDLSVSCDGMTAQKVLAEANTILGGLTSSFSPSEINECATWINEKFDDGGKDGLAPGGSITQFATISNDGSLDFQYTVKVEKTEGDDNFCQTLNLEAKLEGVTSYTGKLMDFVSSPVVYSETTTDWEFVISLPSDADAAGSCSFDFIFSGWQTTLSELGGFSDTERVDDPIHSVIRNVASVTVESEDNNEVTIIEATEATTTESVVIIEATTTQIVIEEATSTPMAIEEVETATSTAVEIIEEIEGIEPSADELESDPIADETVIEDQPVEKVEAEPARPEPEPAPIEVSVEPPVEAPPAPAPEPEPAAE